MVIKEEELLKKRKVDRKKKALKEKILYIKENITIEPVFLMYIISSTLGRLATQNLNLYKACTVNLQYGAEVCNALVAQEGTLYRDQELAVQELVASMEVWKNFILTAIPSLLILFVGAWSDRTGNRKICILVPLVGELLSCFNKILNVYFFDELPLQVFMFFEALLPAITGGWSTLFMGGFSYISEISSEETRTFRVGIANLCFTGGAPIGTALSGVLLKHTGYYGVFTICTVMFSSCISYGMLYIKRLEKPTATNKKVRDGFLGFLRAFFDINHVTDTMTVAFKSGPNQRRTKSILILITIVFVFGPFNGESTIHYLFTRYRFSWDALKFSIFNTFHIAIHALGCVIAISLFSRKWQWGDALLGLISSGSKIMGACGIGFSRNPSHMYMASVVEMFSGLTFTALRSMSSKLVSSDELGKMIAVFNLTEILTSMLFGPLYSWLYVVTLKVDSSIVWYCSGLLAVPAFSIYVWFHIQDKRSAVKNKNDTLNPTEMDFEEECISRNDSPLHQ